MNREDGPRALQRELVGEISKYVNIDSNDIQVKLERQDALEVKIETPPRACRIPEAGCYSAGHDPRFSAELRYAAEVAASPVCTAVCATQYDQSVFRTATCMPSVAHCTEPA